MKIDEYFKDKLSSFIICFGSFLFIITFMLCFNINKVLILLISSSYLLAFTICFINEFLKKKSFYNQINKKIKELDKKFLITEIIPSANFIEGQLLLDYLYEINKNYIEEINKYKYINEELKEYIELWCHEIKTPIATSKLIIDNNKNKTTDNIREEINKIESYVEQVMFYAKSEIVEKDYLITNLNLKKVIESVIKRNKKSLISKQIKINLFNENVYIKSDTKWLEYIINQIIANCIKYSKKNSPSITFLYKENKNNIILSIEDNGIGIKSDELNRIFDKGFTGSNGRKQYASTGIGLYLCKKLCEKLNHDIIIISKENKYTKVNIIFPKSSMITE